MNLSNKFINRIQPVFLDSQIGFCDSKYSKTQRY